MYRVLVEEYNSVGVTKTLDLLIKTEKLYEMLGRYTVKYGPPQELIADEGITELEFFGTSPNEYAGVTVGFVRADKGEQRKAVVRVPTRPSAVQQSTWRSATPPVINEPPEPRIAAMLLAGVLKN